MPFEQEPTNHDKTDVDPLTNAQEALRRFLVDADIGSAKFSAFSDFVVYNQLGIVRQSIREEVQNARQRLRNEGNSHECEMLLIESESQAREMDTTMGTLKTHIHIQEGRIRGYAAYYTQADLLQEQLADTYYTIGEKEYDSAAAFYMKEVRDTMLTPPD